MKLSIAAFSNLFRTKPKYVFVDNSPKSSNLIESVQESINELAPEELISYLNGDYSDNSAKKDYRNGLVLAVGVPIILLLTC